jgi:hypothetical protein
LARVPPGETLEFTHRNLSTLPQPEAQRARSQFEKLLRRRTGSTAGVAAVALTISENRAGYLLVAELRRGGDYHVETEPFQAARPTTRPRFSLLKRLLWEQPDPILDLVRAEDRLYVLTPSQITAHAQSDGRWQLVAASPFAAPPLRDPRGRLLLVEGVLRAWLPGLSCRLPVGPSLALTCDETAAAFPLSGIDVKWISGRNMLESGDWPPFFNVLRLRDLFVVTAADGRALLFDSERRPAGAIPSWAASDMAVIDSPCAPQHLVALRDASTLQVYEFAGRQLTEAGEPEPLAGALTALWPLDDGALAVVRDANTDQYAAYHVSVACRP